jgi:outer membrane protein assembly factor BamB
MFMGNPERTGLQSTPTTFNSSTVNRLTIRWSYLIGDQTTSSPVTANGVVYVATGGGQVIAFSEATGTPIWERQLGAPITMTPTIDSGIVFVATHTPPAQLFALDAASGATRWQTSFPGSMRGEPLALGGIVYVPESGGDEGECHQGGIRAYQELTGTAVWHWTVNALPNDGGSVWAPISYDGHDLVFGTGNGCSMGIVNANSIVRLNLLGQQDWLSPQIVNSKVDDDWGGGAAIYGDRIFAANKNGKLYSLGDSNGTIVWSATQSTIDGAGSIASPATDGTVVIAPSGFVSDATADPSAFVGGYDFSGNLLWRVPTHDVVAGGAALTNDIAFLSTDASIVAVSITSGTVLWSFPSASDDYFYASPAVDSTGVYAVDDLGDVYAFSLSNGSAPSAAIRKTQIATGNVMDGKHPYGSIFTTTPAGAVRVRY